MHNKDNISPESTLSCFIKSTYFRVFFNSFIFFGIRFFTCGTNKEGESYLVEWQESDGVIKRRYFGFEKQSSEVVKFATTKNRFLAAGDECQIKFWDMDNINILLTTDAEGGLQVKGYIYHGSYH